MKQLAEYGPYPYTLKVVPTSVRDTMQQRKRSRQEQRARDWSDVGIARDVLSPFIDPLLDIHALPIDIATSCAETVINLDAATRFRRRNRYELYENPYGSVISTTKRVLESELAQFIHSETADATAAMEVTHVQNGGYIFTVRIGSVALYYGLDGDKIHVNAGNNVSMQDILVATVNQDDPSGVYGNTLTSAFSLLRDQMYAMRYEGQFSQSDITQATIDFSTDTPFAQFHTETTINGRPTEQEVLRYQILPAERNKVRQPNSRRRVLFD